MLSTSVYYAAFYWATYWLMVPLICLRRAYRPSAALVGSVATPKFDCPTFHSFDIRTERDGVKLRVQVSCPHIAHTAAAAAANSSSSSSSPSSPSGKKQKQQQQQQPSSHPSKAKKKKAMLLAAPLGQSGPGIYQPIMRHYGPDEYIYITWDYRGFFNSDVPAMPRALSVPEHARDAKDVLNACGFASCDVMVGHSMGVVVTLEAALLFGPDFARATVLMNGFHGHVFTTAFQYMLRIPFLGDLVSLFIEAMLAQPR